MLSLKPYLISSYQEWIEDNQLTPYLLVQANLPHVIVPTDYIDPSDGTIVLNISAIAISHLDMTKNKNYISFQARFNGALWDICIPYYAVLGIYAEENEEAGIMFELSNDEIEIGQREFLKDVPEKTTATKHPHLRVVKSDQT